MNWNAVADVLPQAITNANVTIHLRNLIDAKLICRNAIKYAPQELA